MLGMFALNMEGIKGSIIQMINHGLSTGALFLIVGMLYERRHTRLISDYGGIMKVMPVFAALFLLVAFSSMGVPGLNGFVGELLILVGAFKSSLIYGLLATTGLVLGAVYLLWMLKRVVYGSITHDENKELKDMTSREYAYLIPIIVFIVWIGVYPKPFLDKMDASVDHLLQVMNHQGAQQASAPAANVSKVADTKTNTNDTRLAVDQRR
jgi:NADH-quinone oxidoreductase subunit M